MILGPVNLLPLILQGSDYDAQLLRALGLLRKFSLLPEQNNGNMRLGPFRTVISSAPPQKPGELLFECHRRCIDIHYVLSGIEGYETAELCTSSEVMPYNENEDCELFRGEAKVNRFLLPAGWAVIFFQGEGHKPRCDLVGSTSPIRKMVVKVK